MNDELTPSERAALRARIVGGAHDIKPVGAHRNAWIAGSVAAAMVVAIAGGVAVTSTLSAPEIATTPSPSPTVTAAPVPVPTPTATPTQEPVVLPRGSAPFDGACDNVIDGADLDAAAGMKMGRVGPDWIDSAATVRGGIECLWYSSEEYSAAFVEVGVFPDGQQPTNPALVQDPGCRDNYGRLLCTRQGAADGMNAWVRISSVRGTSSRRVRTVCSMPCSRGSAGIRSAWRQRRFRPGGLRRTVRGWQRSSTPRACHFLM